MSSNPHEGIYERSMPTNASSPRNKNTTHKTSISSLILSRAPPVSHPADPGPSQLVCPVSGCSSVFKGEMAHRRFWRHLKHPDLRGLTCDEEVAWINLHENEHEQLLAALGLLPPQP
ncbi:hypothetical protein HOY80DRAFT_998592 [Tuber brumale]|nr:hypothetical protein HOY80DRAFT_998592 [Tuber brumale]